MKEPDVAFDLHYCNKKADFIFDTKLSDSQSKENLNKSQNLLLQKRNMKELKGCNNSFDIA